MVVIRKQPTLLPTCGTDILSLDLSSPFRWLPFIPIITSGCDTRPSPSLILGRWSFSSAHRCGYTSLSLAFSARLEATWAKDCVRLSSGSQKNSTVPSTYIQWIMCLNEHRNANSGSKSSLKILLKGYSTHNVQMDLTMKLCLNGFCLSPNLWLTRVWGH